MTFCGSVFVAALRKNEIKKACKNAARKEKLYNFFADHGKKKNSRKSFPAVTDYFFILKYRLQKPQKAQLIKK